MFLFSKAWLILISGGQKGWKIFVDKTDLPVQSLHHENVKITESPGQGRVQGQEEKDQETDTLERGQDRDAPGVEGRETDDQGQGIGVHKIGRETGGTDPGKSQDLGQSQGHRDVIHLQGLDQDLQGHLLGQVQGHAHPNLVQGQDQGQGIAIQ